MKVCILAAGIGSRLGERTRFFNKAILRVGNKAAISHTIDYFSIDYFPQDTEFVIALGYQKDIVKQYLQIAHPKTNFTFVETEKYSGPGSGAGYALLECKQHLDEPFYFVCCDSIIDWNIFKIPIEKDWVICSTISDEQKTQYCTVKKENMYATQFFDKTKEGTNLAFTGGAFIKSHEDFWKNLEKSRTDQSEIRDTPAIFALKPLVFERMWWDIGCESGLKKARERFGGIQNLDKLDEEIYFQGDSVIKYFYNEKMAEDRVKRVQYLAGTVPELERFSKNFYSYPKKPGKDLFKIEVSQQMMTDLLDYAQNRLWSQKNIFSNELDERIFKDSCKKFYYDKTISRVKKLYEKINVSEVQKSELDKCFKKISWDYISDGIAAKFHGDFNFSNVLYDEEWKFTFLDWRQNFGDRISHGDVYYDLAKMYHSFLFPHSSIQSEKFYTLTQNNGKVKTFIEVPFHIERCKDSFESWVVEHGYDLWKIKILTAIVLLNMSPLHEAPIDKYLYFYSKQYLSEALNES